MQAGHVMTRTMFRVLTYVMKVNRMFRQFSMGIGGRCQATCKACDTAWANIARNQWRVR